MRWRNFAGPIWRLGRPAGFGMCWQALIRVPQSESPQENLPRNFRRPKSLILEEGDPFHRSTNVGCSSHNSNNQHEQKPNNNRLTYDHQEVAIILNNLGLLYNDQGNLAEAEPLYKRTLEILARTYGTEHPEVATIIFIKFLFFDR